eukprot:CAMPEP_0202383532 /NCGR_PEP_ID=MMETSP1127-20130417/49720_1 /ASSEMBLY_ACC=CAM_ASM_000462 /TAXON_ID=3047 /ORGANISM="Dunaliella tertiolecta, Strain CCMP1320" /LENGTH=81 /DNA_ID=CAMNT_0048983053 /DNA_START=42 /DNA_END=283 /DNA_ORIENTATION=+
MPSSHAGTIGASAFAYQGTNAHMIVQARQPQHSQKADTDPGAIKASSSNLPFRRSRHWILPPASAMLQARVPAVHMGPKAG